MLLCRFDTFFRILRTVVASTIDAGFGENCAVFLQSSSQTEHFVQPHSFLLHSSIPYILYSSHCDHFFPGITRVLIVNHFLEIILHVYGFLFVPLDDWRTSENRRRLVEGKIS
jgi:hypothetical protein